MEETSEKKGVCMAHGRGLAIAVTLLRLVIGWHFLYEGLWKLFQQGGWTCRGYLEASVGSAAPLFKWMAAQNWLVALSDQLVMWGLVALGLSLLSGILARIAAPFGMLLLSFFFLAQPPAPFVTANAAAGRFFLIDDGVLEILALLTVACVPVPNVLAILRGRWRLPLLSLLVSLFFAGAFYKVWRSGELKPKPVGTYTAATVKKHIFSGPEEIKAPLQAKAKLGNLEVPRVVLASEYFSGNSHGRDLIWTDEFMRRYNAPETLARTLAWARVGGLNAVCGGPALLAKLQENALASRHLVFISDCSGQESFGERLQRSMRLGAAAVMPPPDELDAFAAKGDDAALEKYYNALKDTKLPFGLAARRVSTLQRCVDRGFVPDFWAISYHATNYPSASPRVAKRVKSVWCEDPKAVEAFFKTRKEPWMAFDVTAYGARPITAALNDAACAGASVIALEILDFQVTDAVNDAVRILDGKEKK